MPRRRLRVGYVSPDLHTHAVACFFEGVLAAHDPEAIETVCYQCGTIADAIAALGSINIIAGELDR